MVRFLCFLSPIAHHRSKKVARSSSESMSMNTQENYQDQATNSENNASNTSVDHEGCWQSEDLNGNFCPNESKNLIQMGRLKKSQSLGSVLDNRRGFSVEDITEDNDVDQEFAFDFSHEVKIKKVGDSIDEMHPPEVDIHHDDHHKVVEFFDSIANPSHHESIFSIGVPEQFNGELNGDVKEHFTDPFVEHLPLPSNALPVFAKSRSLTNLGMDTASSNEDVLAHELSRPQSRSFEDMRSLEEGRDESLNGDGTICSETTCKRHITSHLDGKGSHVHMDSVDECILSKTNGEFNEVLDHEREHKYLSGMFQWREFEPNGVEIKEKFQLDSSVQNWGELTSEEFNIKRIEQWISQIDIQENCVYEEIGESSHPAPKKDPKVVSGVTTAMPGPSSPSMELAYNYISTLTATSSSAQMSNLGLVAVPFLGVFVSLRVLNLSNNAIVRITSGVLPRGLHMLNLSKNNISAIEGLRDLTRLRVLDLSYNRIVRIGHGLASCSSIKELYLAGNKISEVDGLHRLLKLNVLDLHFNKISTVKGLGQLAANYGTLQAINLEGNPAQRNVGEDQLKKHLLSLLPHLAYYNKHAIKASSSKEILERPPRSITSHPMDRGMRTEQHRSRRGAPASNHSRASRAASSSSKHSRGQHGHLPPTGARGSSNHLPEILLKVGSTPSNNNSIRRSQSVGTL